MQCRMQFSPKLAVLATGLLTMCAHSFADSVVATTTPAVIDPAAKSQVMFLGVDKTTQGNWVGTYGSGGYFIPGLAPTVLDHTNLSFTEYFEYTWAGLTSDPRALLISPGSPGGIASAIVNYWGASFYIHLNVYDTKRHEVAFYLLDWDGTSRVETFTITDASTSQLLETRSFSDFHNGKYVVFSMKGNLLIKVTPTAGPSAAVSGIFID